MQTIHMHCYFLSHVLLPLILDTVSNKMYNNMPRYMRQYLHCDIIIIAINKINLLPKSKSYT